MSGSAAHHEKARIPVVITKIKKRISQADLNSLSTEELRQYLSYHDLNSQGKRGNIMLRVIKHIGRQGDPESQVATPPTKGRSKASSSSNGKNVAAKVKAEPDPEETNDLKREPVYADLSMNRGIKRRREFVATKPDKKTDELSVLLDRERQCNSYIREVEDLLLNLRQEQKELYQRRTLLLKTELAKS